MTITFADIILQLQAEREKLEAEIDRLKADKIKIGVALGESQLEVTELRTKNKLLKATLDNVHRAHRKSLK